MSYNFFFELRGCDPPLTCDLDLFRHRVNSHRHNHQAENRNQCSGNFCPLKDPDCQDCAIDDALDDLASMNYKHAPVFNMTVGLDNNCQSHE